ncbi:unnamed protein product, partial [Allacma fusca]
QPDSNESQEDEAPAQEAQATTKTSAQSESKPAVKDAPAEAQDDDSKEDTKGENDSQEDDDNSNESTEDDDDDSDENSYVPRSREHLDRILALADTEKSKELSTLVDKATQTTLKELKSVYENAIKPLETLYKYRDLSNRHFG